MTMSPVSNRKKKLVAPIQQSSVSAVAEEMRYAMIAEAAYYLAEHRGFIGNSESAYLDWLGKSRLTSFSGSAG